MLLMLALPASAQEEMSSDEMYQEARRLAHSGQREEARDLCRKILDHNPNYYDARILLGRTYAWDKQFTSARIALAKVLEAKPRYADARNALMDAERWAGNDEEVVRLADEGLALDPGNAAFLSRKARALAGMGQEKEAAHYATLAWKAEPENREYRKSYRRILDEALRNKFTVGIRREWFNDVDPWGDGSLQYRYAFDWGSLLGRVNFARRFDRNGRQIEVDAYPRVAEHTYLYLNVGYSNTDLFPDTRFAAEVYHNFPKGWEASLGFRRLNFESTNVTIYTGTFAKYLGNWWISLRPNYVVKGRTLEVPGENLDVGTSSYSAQIAARRYLGSRYEYIGIVVSAGSGDQLANVPVGGPIDADQRVQTDGFRVSGELRKRITNTVILRGTLGYRSQELVRDATRKSWFLVFGVEKYW